MGLFSRFKQKYITNAFASLQNDFNYRVQSAILDIHNVVDNLKLSQLLRESSSIQQYSLKSNDDKGGENLRLERHNSTSTESASIVLVRGRLSGGSLAAVNSGDVLAGIYARGYYSSSQISGNVGAFLFFANSNFSGSDYHTRAEIQLTPSGSTSRGLTHQFNPTTTILNGTSTTTATGTTYVGTLEVNNGGSSSRGINCGSGTSGTVAFLDLIAGNSSNTRNDYTIRLIADGDGNGLMRAYYYNGGSGSTDKVFFKFTSTTDNVTLGATDAVPTRNLHVKALTVDGDILPKTTDIYDIGSALKAMKDGYFLNAITVTCNAEKKEIVKPICPNFSRNFFKKLKENDGLTWFKFKDLEIEEIKEIDEIYNEVEKEIDIYDFDLKAKGGLKCRKEKRIVYEKEIKEVILQKKQTITHKRLHPQIATVQQIQKTLNDLNIDTNDFSPIILDKDDNGNYTKPVGSRIEEFIPLLVSYVVSIDEKLEMLENENKILKDILTKKGIL